MKNNYLENLEKIESLYNELIGSSIYKDFHQDYKSRINKAYKNLNNEIPRFKIEKEKIEKDELPLIVGFAGGFNTGKSSIINSILEEELLAVKINPATAKVSILKYGDEQKIIAINKDNTTEGITVFEYKQLSSHLEETSNNEKLSKKQKKIKHFEIQYPNEILRNINIIDTPGFFSNRKGDDSISDDSISKEWMEKLDVIIWTFDAGNKKAVGADEKKILKKLKDKKIIAVLNKMEFKFHKKDEYVHFYKDTDYFEEVLIYSAKKILNSKKNKIYNNKIIDDIVKKAKEERENSNLVIEISKNKISLFNKSNISNISENIYYDKNVKRFREKETGKFVSKKKDKKEILKQDILKIDKGANFENEYNQLKKILEELHLKSKDLKINSYNLNIEKLVISYLHEIEKLKNELEYKKSSEEKDLNRLHIIIDNFTKGFNRQINKDNKNILKSKLFPIAVKLYKKEQIKKLNNLIEKSFKDFKDKQEKFYNDFIKDQDLEKYEKIINTSNFEGLNYWLKELTSASINSIKGLKLAYFPPSDLNRIKESIDLVVPDEQLYNVVKKTINNKLSDLKKRIEDKFQNKIDIIAQFLNKIEKIKGV